MAVIGGQGQSALDAPLPVEIFDPSTLQFEDYRPHDLAERPALTALPTGKVLLTGGLRSGQASAEMALFDPETRSFSQAGSMAEPREGHEAQLLDDGAVLIAGGRGADGAPRSTAERYDPLTGQSQPVGAMTSPRADFKLLRSRGGLLALGGNPQAATVDRYDPQNRSFSAEGSLQKPRVHPAAIRLASGDILVAGGLTAQGKPEGAVERYSPRQKTSEAVATLLIPGQPGGLSLASGVMFAGDNYLAYLDAPAPPELLDTSYGKLLTSLGLPTGDRLMVGDGETLLLSYQGGPLRTERKTRYASWARSALLPGGEALLLGDQGSWHIRRPDPKGTARPALLDVPLELPTETAISLKGSRLTRPSGSPLSGPSQALAPSIFFLPEGGDPLFASVLSWDDDEVSFRIPKNPFHGPGRLFAAVDGVLGGGVFARLLPLPLGATCGQASECGSDLCVDGVCCDRPCEGACESCLGAAQAEGVDGECGLARELTNPRGACSKDGTTCGLQGHCDGEGKCAVAADLTPCGLDDKGTCQQGACVTPLPSVCNADLTLAQLSDGSTQVCAPYRCDGGACLSACERDEQCAGGFSCADGACRACAPDGRAVLIDGVPVPCGAYRCSAGACAASCAGDQDCQDGFRCAQGACGPYCDERDEAVIEGPSRTPCAPFRCVDSRCPTSCKTGADCAVGLACMSDGRCLPPPQADPEPQGCSAAPRPAPSPPWALLLAAAWWRRSRRARALALAALLGRGEARAEGPPQPAPDQQKLDSAKEEFRRGIIFFEAAEYEVALEHFRRSRGLFPSKPNTVNMAVCLDKLGRHDEAIELYEEALSRFAADLSDDERRAVPGVIAGLRAKVGEIEILSPAEAELLVDGRPRGSLPRPTALRALPGRRVVRATREGYSPFEAAVEVRPGERARVEVRFQLLDGAGRLRVEADDLKGGVLLVDGSQVGELPWEGPLPPGTHVVQARSGARGSPLVASVVVAGQITLLRLRGGPLGPPTRISASPASARLRLDGVDVGRGTWSGHLPEGSHRAELSEEGYRPLIHPFEVTPTPAGDISLSLAIDPTHPRWPRPRGGFFWVDGRAVGAVGPSLASGAGQRCGASCSSSLASGAGGLARIGYEFSWGLSFGLTAGYLWLSQSISRDAPHPNPLVATRYRIEHSPDLRGFLVAGTAAYAIPLAARWSLHGSLAAGVLLSTARDRPSAQATAAGETASTQIPGKFQSIDSAPVALLPELALSRRLGSLHLFASLSALFIPASGPTYERSSVFVTSGCPAKASPSSVGCTPEARLLDDQRAYGPFALVLPGLGLRYSLGNN